MKLSKENYPKILLFVFIIIWIVSAISPNYRGVWIAEMCLPVLFVIFLILTYKKFRFSNLSYSLFFIFLVMTLVGGHYSYAEVPLFNLIKDSLNLTRNHYDRLVHFAFGLLFFYPTYEFISKKLKITKQWAFLIALSIIVALKGIFEVMEYLAVVITNTPTLNLDFLGLQGDMWDAQKDLGWGIIGACIAWLWMWIKSILKK